jgi:hypothetical protein
MEPKLDEQYPDALTFITGCVVESDYVYVAAYSDAHDPRETIFSRLCVFMKDDDPWSYHDIAANIESVCVKKATPMVGRRLCALSKEGEVEIYSNKDATSVIEKIPEAGLRLGSHGYVLDIREIGNSLFVCGANDQVYRRDDATGTWSLITAAPLKLVEPLDPYYSMLTSIDGTNENDVYTCGMGGRLYHFDGLRWQAIELQTDEHLNCVRCVSPDEVWICGENGTLLTGSFRAGFTNVSTVDENSNFWSLTKFKDKIYLATPNEGMFVYDGASITPLNTGLASELWTYIVDSTTEMLWSVGPKEIACFDGVTWSRVDHPDNEPVA